MRRLETPDGRTLQEFQPEVVREMDFDPEARQVVVDALTAVVNEPGGTAYRARLPEVQIAGKTGTAQVIALGKMRVKKEAMTWWQRDHAWFASFAPADDPEIAVVVLNEHGGHGGLDAAPTATAIIKKYFELKREDASATIAASTALPVMPLRPLAPPPAPRLAAPPVPGGSGSGADAGAPGGAGARRGCAVMVGLRIERRMVVKIPWGLVAVTLAIALLGIWNLASASRPPHTPLWSRQLLNLGVGVAGRGGGLPDRLPLRPADGLADLRAERGWR